MSIYYFYKTHNKKDRPDKRNHSGRTKIIRRTIIKEIQSQHYVSEIISLKIKKRYRGQARFANCAHF